MSGCPKCGSLDRDFVDYIINKDAGCHWKIRGGYVVKWKCKECGLEYEK
jgi:rubredoxin